MGKKICFIPLRKALKNVCTHLRTTFCGVRAVYLFVIWPCKTNPTPIAESKELKFRWCVWIGFWCNKKVAYNLHAYRFDLV